MRLRSVTVVAALMLIAAIAPTVSADVDPQLSTPDSDKPATTSDPAVYEITIRNNGDDDMTYTLTTQQGAGCNGFTSSVDSPTGSVNSNSDELVDLEVQVDDTASGDCETTLTIQATGPTPPPQSDSLTVTTTAEDGGLYSVVLTTGALKKDYDLEGDSIDWIVNVENNGDQQANVQLTVENDSGCDSDDDSVSASVDPATVNLNSGDNEDVDFQITLDDESETDAGEHCFILRATVTNDPTNGAEDNLTLTGVVPQIRTCVEELDWSFANLQPGQTSSPNNIEVINTGNTAWTAAVQAQSVGGEDISGWVSFDSPTSKLLAEPNNNGDSFTFGFDITPDSSVESGSSVDIRIMAKAGSSVGCEATVTIKVGQIHSGDISINTGSVSNVEPGSQPQVTIYLENTGNGADTFTLATEPLPSGWSISFSPPSHSLNAAQTSQNQGSSTAVISVPDDALAGSTQVVFKVTGGGGSGTLDTVALNVNVNQRHEVTIDFVSTAQNGRTDQIVRFPFIVTNEGNVEDTIKLQVCNPGDQTGCNSPQWAASYSDSNGNGLSQVQLSPGQSRSLFLDVNVEGEENADSAKILARAAVFGADADAEETVTVTVSNYNYTFEISPVNPGLTPGQLDVTLPPGGETTLSFFVDNTGDYPAGDDLVIDISGLEALVIRTISIQGNTITAPIPVQPGDRIQVDIRMEVVQGSANGLNGLMKVSAYSALNPNEISSIDIAVEIRTIHDLRLTMEEPTKQTTAYPDKGEYSFFVTNNGNIVEDVVIIPTESLRGWSVDIVPDDFELEPGQTMEVEVSTLPPADLISDDEYRFTIVVQPKGLPAAGQPLDLITATELPAGFLALSEDVEQIIVIGLIAIGVATVAVLALRSRRESERILEALGEDRRA
ncbi:MAG: hypothetical protein VX942_00210 [Candidatus Thermoplasmatota archaeon]|nr:hypothetical protein [Candidatus Thermoplasmatota archaeon]